MREPQLIVATGKKGVGKTYTTKIIISSYVRPNRRTGKVARKVLIYDVNMEYDQYKTIGLNDIIKFSKQKRAEIRRVLPITEEGKIAHIDEIIDILYVILEKFRGGLLVLEDINRYLVETRSKEVIGTLATNRHRDMDIIIHLQSLAPMTPRMWQNTSVVRFHSQLDNVENYKQRLPNFELYKIAQCLVNMQNQRGNPHFFCYVSNDESNIKGKFSKLSYKKAVEEFLETHPSLINAAQKRYGTGKDARQQGKRHLTNDLMKYYGN